MTKTNGSMKTIVVILRRLRREEARIEAVVAKLTDALAAAKAELRIVQDSLRPLVQSDKSSRTRKASATNEVTPIIGSAVDDGHENIGTIRSVDDGKS